MNFTRSQIPASILYHKSRLCISVQNGAKRCKTVHFYRVSGIFYTFLSQLFQAAGVTVILLEWKWLTLGSHFLRECNEQFFFFLLLFFIYIQLWRRKTEISFRCGDGGIYPVRHCHLFSAFYVKISPARQAELSLSGDYTITQVKESHLAQSVSLWFNILTFSTSWKPFPSV